MLRQFVEWLESGEKSPGDLLALCLARIRECDPSVRAWVEVAPRPAPSSGPLRAIPYGAKDIFETAGMATEYGSPLYAGRRGQADAAIVRQLELAGARLLGKTHTTAFASFDPAPTQNPRLPGHTPGGSSSGSAAAVAARMIPFAIGTQTLGSVLRPASYCGICGLKPGHSRISTDGLLPFAPSLDTIGFFTETAADMSLLWTRFDGAAPASLLRAAYFPVPADAEMHHAVAAAVDLLRASGLPVDQLPIPGGWTRLVESALLVNACEGARSHRDRFLEFGDRLGLRLSELLRRGAATSGDEYKSALSHIDHTRREIARLFDHYSVVLCPAAQGAAPAGMASTGDPSHNAPWTALGLPAIAIPLQSPRPLGLQIIAPSGHERQLVAAAETIERLCC